MRVCNLTPSVIISLIIFAVSGCANSYKNTVNFNPAEPLRVAVLPFFESDGEGKPVVRDSALGIDKVALVSQKLQEDPATLVQNAVQRELGKTRLDIVAPGLVAAQLSHNGFVNSKQYDHEKILATSPKQLCELLYCDALLYGVVTDWDRSYYGVQTINSVGVKLRMIRVGDGAEIFSSIAEDSEGRGLSGIPTGFSSVVLEPIKGLDNEIIADLAGRVVTKSLAPLHTESRPEFLNSSAPAIFASSHDGTGRTISSSAPLTVLLLGSAKKKAYFSVGENITQLPMYERDDGHYVGEFYPLRGEKFPGQDVYVFLHDEYGRISKQRVGVGGININ